MAYVLLKALDEANENDTRGEPVHEELKKLNSQLDALFATPMSFESFQTHI